MAYVRTVKTASGAVAVQIVHGNRRGSREIEHLGSARTPAEVEVLKTVARQRLHANQDTLDLDDGQPGEEEAAIVSSQARHLWQMLTTAYQVLGFDRACGGDEVFGLLTLARVVEPSSKLDAIRVLSEIGVAAPSHPTIKRRLPVYAAQGWRDALAAACAAQVGLGPATLVLYDVTTLYFETDQGDGFREPGFSKERRLEPQITVGLLTDVRGFPLQVHAFEGNTAETRTILPVAGVRRRARPAGGGRGRRRRDAVRGQLEGAGRHGAAVRRRRPDPRRPLPGPQVGAGPTPTSRSRTNKSSSSPRPWAPRPTCSAARSSTSTAPTGPAAPSRGSTRTTKKLVHTLRGHRSITIRTGEHILRAGTPLHTQTRAVIDAVKKAATAH